MFCTRAALVDIVIRVKYIPEDLALFSEVGIIVINLWHPAHLLLILIMYKSKDTPIAKAQECTSHLGTQLTADMQ